MISWGVIFHLLLLETRGPKGGQIDPLQRGGYPPPLGPPQKGGQNPILLISLLLDFPLKFGGTRVPPRENEQKSVKNAFFDPFSVILPTFWVFNHFLTKKWSK